MEESVKREERRKRNKEKEGWKEVVKGKVGE